MNLQLMVTSLLIAGIVVTNCERERRLSEKVEAYETQIVELTAAYKQQLLDLPQSIPVDGLQRWEKHLIELQLLSPSGINAPSITTP